MLASLVSSVEAKDVPSTSGARRMSKLMPEPSTSSYSLFSLRSNKSYRSAESRHRGQRSISPSGHPLLDSHGAVDMGTSPMHDDFDAETVFISPRMGRRHHDQSRSQQGRKSHARNHYIPVMPMSHHHHHHRLDHVSARWEGLPLTSDGATILETEDGQTIITDGGKDDEEDEPKTIRGKISKVRTMCVCVL
jgi:hypothetical protein